MRARDLDLPPGTEAELCIARGLVGIGPGHGHRRDGLVHRFAIAEEDGFLWTRDRSGGYHLGRLDGSLRETRETALAAVGITHVRAALWLPEPVPEADVPPAVSHTFARGGRNFQRTHDGEAEALTAQLWARSG